MTQIGILLALEKSNLSLKELMNITRTRKGSIMKQASILRRKGHIIRLVKEREPRQFGNQYYYEITEQGRERLKKMRDKHEG